ncbi:MAG: tetratricopeptide repeat protein, partial [Verrucomicrobiales bacterium]
ALAALAPTPANPDEAARQLAALTPEQEASLPPGSLALAKIRLHDRRNDWAQAAEIAHELLGSLEQGSLRDTIRFEQGKALFANKDYNDARLVLQGLAEDSPDSPQAPAALLLAARAAAEGGTPQSQGESLELFDMLIESASDFHAVARLEKADLLIRLSRLQDAIDTLGPWFSEMSDDDPLLISIGLLLGDALFAHAEGDHAVLDQGLKVYDRLLTVLPESSDIRSRILYQKGLALEQFEGRTNEALATYINVVDSAVGETRGDWQSIELCGFSALRILEKREEWPAAKTLAERIAALKGPRSAEAADRARSIGLEHFIWEDGRDS